jgi:hypothetical protein
VVVGGGAIDRNEDVRELSTVLGHGLSGQVFKRTVAVNLEVSRRDTDAATPCHMPWLSRVIKISGRFAIAI